MSPEARKDRTIQALNRIVLKGSEIRPLILSVEDLHWMDKTSEEVFKDFLEHIAGARVLLLFTYRPEYVHTWGGRSYHSQVTLNRLSNRESLTMSRYVLGTENITETLANLILEKTEGVPFFIEEFLKSLRERNVIERVDDGYVLARNRGDMTIPATIQDVLMARVDTLPDGAKEVLQTGAAIEREFPHELLQKITGLPELELLSHLSALKDAELLYERGVYPQSTYIFKHALTREVVYESILGKKRAQLHDVIGAATEELYAATLGEHYGALSAHFIAGENYAKGAEYSRLAERQAEKATSFWDAAGYAKKRISCLEKLPGSPEVEKKIVDARTALGLHLLQQGQLDQAMQAIAPITDAALQLASRPKVSQVYTILGYCKAYVSGEILAGIRDLRRALAVAQETNHRTSVSFATLHLADALTLDCQWKEAAGLFQKALQITVAAKNPQAVAAVQSFLGLMYSYQGDVRLACETSEGALKLAEESGDIWPRNFACAMRGFALFRMGSLERSLCFPRAWIWRAELATPPMR
jgi:tetratricopeptide (TPR) repeat protein